MDAVKKLVTDAILEEFEIPECSSPLKNTTTTTTTTTPTINAIKVADLGCAVGPTTFFHIQNILNAVELKYSSGNYSQIPEFQVFFNDQTSNDFNTLFASLPPPPDRRYHAAGVPGSFHSRLFPSSSLHIVFSSAAVHWLSAMPKEVEDRSSPGWNKGRIYHLNAADDFLEAYSYQHAQDMARFLDARAQEIVDGGLMILFFPGRLDGTLPSQFISHVFLYLVGSCLLDMANKGKISQEKVDSFNLPMHVMSSQELKEAIDRNGCFSLVKLESLFYPSRYAAQEAARKGRPVMERLINKHFGDEFLDEVFDSFVEKIGQEDSLIQSIKSMFFVAVLKRKTSN